MKKRTKTTKRLQILVLALGFVCCVLLVFRFFIHNEPAVDNQTHYGKQVQVLSTTPLYQKNHEHYKEIGAIEKGQVLALSEKSKQNMKDSYFQLKNNNYYILADHVSPTKQKAKEEKIVYVPFNEAITTKETYQINDGTQHKIATMKQHSTYPIYVKDKNSYGVVIAKQIVYIPKQDIARTQPVQNTKAQTATSVPVFMYHYFYSKANHETGKNGNYLEVNAFEDQLKYLQEHKYSTLNMEEIENFLDGKVQLPKNSVSITIDDGTKSIYKYAYPLLKKYDDRATLFLIGNKFKDDKLPKEFQVMKAGGMELESHSYALHTGGCTGGHGGALRCVGHDQGVADTKKSFAIIGGGNVYCYPFGDVTDSALQIMKDSGVHMAFTTQYGPVQAGMDKLQLPRVRIFGDAGLAQFINSLEN